VTIIEVLFICVVMSVAMLIVYGQYLMLKDRYEFRKKHGFDPWRHGWKTDNDKKD
jgi:hypothetical protein